MNLNHRLFVFNKKGIMTIINTTKNEFGVYPKRFSTTYTVIFRDLVSKETITLECINVILKRGVVYIPFVYDSFKEGATYYISVFIDDEIVWYGNGIALEDINNLNNYQPFEITNDFIKI